jgi:hypothetical protein
MSAGVTDAQMCTCTGSAQVAWASVPAEGQAAEGGSGSGVVDAVLLRLVHRNNERIARLDPWSAQPRILSAEGLLPRLRSDAAVIRREWQEFALAESRLPTIDALMGGHQGQVGSWWRASPLVMMGRPVPGLADHFPLTVRSLVRTPRLRFAMWSVFGPGAELPEHVGTNSGYLRLLFAVDAGPSAWIRIGGVDYRLTDGDGVIFDDLVPHQAINASSQPRVLLMCDLDRELPLFASLSNRALQRLRLFAFPQYRRVADRAAEFDRALNPPPMASRSRAAGVSET